MTLLDRLRDNDGDGHPGGCQGCYHTVMDDAADEIERLSSALRNLLGQVEQAKEGFGLYAKSPSMDAAIAHTKVLLGSP